MPAELIDWQGQPVEAGLDREGRAPELALHRARRRTTPCSSQVLRRSRRACRSARSSSAAAARRRCRSSCRRSTGCNGVFFGATLGSRDDRRRDRQGRRRAPRPDGDAALLRLQHGRVLRALARRCRRTIDAPAEDLPRELVPQGQGRQVPLAGLRREHARPQVDRRPRAPPRRRPGDAVRLGARRRAISISPASTSRPSSVDEATHIDLDEWRAELESHGEFFERLGPHMPQRAQAPARAAPRAHREHARPLERRAERLRRPAPACGCYAEAE